MLIRERACPGKTHNATPGSKKKKTEIPGTNKKVSSNVFFY